MKRRSRGELTLMYGLEPIGPSSLSKGAIGAEIRNHVRQVPDHMVDLLREHCRDVCTEDVYDFEGKDMDYQVRFVSGTPSASAGRLLFCFQDEWRFHLARYYNTGENDDA